MIRKTLVAAVAVLVLAGCDPAPAEDDPRFDCATMGNASCAPGVWSVSRHEGRTYIVTPDGVLLIVPVDGSCVRIAVGETDDAPCLPED